MLEKLKPETGFFIDLLHYLAEIQFGVYYDNALNIFTDGSSAPKPRAGGIGFRMVFPDDTTRDFSPLGYRGATNNEMELQAAILALREVLKLPNLKGSQLVIIHTDSQYLVDNFSKARVVWPWRKWLRADGQPVLNVPQWKELVRLSQRVYRGFHVPVSFEKVKAHSGHIHNTAVDALAKKSRKGPQRSLQISTSKVRRKISAKKTVAGSVQGEGKQIRIRAITTSYLRQQKLYRTRFEVLSKKSKYFGNVDFVISKENLSAGHVYDVILEAGLTHCRVRKVVREIIKKAV